jgi:hypothetical protein
MIKFLLAVAVVVLCFIQAGWLSMFCLELFFDTSRSTAAERARTIFRYVVFLGLVQVGIIVIFMLILFSDPGTSVLGF